MSPDHLEFLAEIASLYYEESLSQGEIAVRTGYSRSMVSRFLTEARQEGLVEIRVHHPITRRLDLERELQDSLNLGQVRVVASGELRGSQALRRLGSMAARIIEEQIEEGSIIGVSWGTALYETVNALRPSAHNDVHVVQMIGSLGTPDPMIDGPELARHLARTLAGRYTTLPAPLFVDSPDTRQSLMNESQVQRVVEQFRDIQLAIVGVGTIEPGQASLLRAGYLTLSQLEELRHAGAVGDVCAIHFDQDGHLIDTPLTRRIVGIDAETLAAIPSKIGIAGGYPKVPAITGAARAGFINTLVTDELTATSILSRLKANEQIHSN